MISLEGLSFFLDNLEEGVIFLDQDRHVLAINQAAAAMIGQQHDRVVGELCPTLFPGTRCARACDASGRCCLMASEERSRDVQDVTLKRPDGTLVPLRMWAMLLPRESPGDSLAYYAVVLRDRAREVQLEEQASRRMQLGKLVGHSPAMQELFRQILRAAASEATVLITGESGAGKELIAQALHENSNRAKGPYVRVHCAALPENLLEAELFGHARGAFTGATAARVGRFEAADGGTLLLDEIGEVPLSTQVKLLRVLQEREVERLGENRARKVDVRVIAATHRNLPAMVERGDFRADLYYRLRVLPMHAPALRERDADVPLLAGNLLEDLAKRYRRGEVQLSQEALRTMQAYDWPGNVRELLNALEYALVQANGDTILRRHLPSELQRRPHDEVAPARPPASLRPSLIPYYRPPQDEEEERQIILGALAESGGNRTVAAGRLGMSRTTLWKRLKLYGIDA